MRLLSYISLRSHGKDIKLGYPLGLQIVDLEVIETECNEEFMKHIIPTLEWETLQKCTEAVGIQGLPATYNAALLEDSEFLKFVHNLLLDIHVLKGALICPETERSYPIEDGIPNMM
jgi:multifunctional methyltransferase subunit TRM112